MAKNVLVRHTVADYANWKVVFDNHQGERQKHGLKDLYVLRDTTNINNVTILLAAEDLEKAKAFISSNDLRETMKKAGVISTPEIFLLSDVTNSN